jgi:hypothetical protein
VKHGGPGSGLTRAQKAAEWRCDDGEGGGGGALGVERGEGGAGEERWEEWMPGHPFIGSEGERGGWASERNGQRRWRVIMVMKAAIFEGDRPEWLWGVTRGVCFGHYGSRSGARRRHVRT